MRGWYYLPNVAVGHHFFGLCLQIDDSLPTAEDRPRRLYDLMKLTSPTQISKSFGASEPLIAIAVRWRPSNMLATV
jgi:hypothetical protein